MPTSRFSADNRLVGTEWTAKTKMEIWVEILQCKGDLRRILRLAKNRDREGKSIE